MEKENFIVIMEKNSIQVFLKMNDAQMIFKFDEISAIENSNMDLCFFKIIHSHFY